MAKIAIIIFSELETMEAPGRVSNAFFPADEDRKQGEFQIINF
jgi:hypothetical protein